MGQTPRVNREMSFEWHDRTKDGDAEFIGHADLTISAAWVAS